MIGYHFLRADPARRHPEDREIVIGETLRKDAPPRLTHYGYHASRRVLDAWSLAGTEQTIVIKALLAGQIIHGANESVASERTILAVCDASDVLVRLARRAMQAALAASELTNICKLYLLDNVGPVAFDHPANRLDKRQNTISMSDLDTPRITNIFRRYLGSGIPPDGFADEQDRRLTAMLEREFRRAELRTDLTAGQ